MCLGVLLVRILVYTCIHVCMHTARQTEKKTYIYAHRAAPRMTARCSTGYSSGKNMNHASSYYRFGSMRRLGKLHGSVHPFGRLRREPDCRKTSIHKRVCLVSDLIHVALNHGEDQNKTDSNLHTPQQHRCTQQCSHGCSSLSMLACEAIIHFFFGPVPRFVLAVFQFACFAFFCCFFISRATSVSARASSSVLTGMFEVDTVFDAFCAMLRRTHKHTHTHTLTHSHTHSLSHTQLHRTCTHRR